MQSLLAMRPDIATFEVFNKGGGGETLAQMEARLQRDVLDLGAQVMILQTGTIEAINPQSPSSLDDFRKRLGSVVTALKPKVSIILMNSQHYPAQPAGYVAYQDVMEQVSAEQDVPIFDRYALMKSWIDSGRYRFNEILASDNFHTNDFTYRCVGEVMAELVLARTAGKGS
jgi:lysophospholipase L1-like esterase